MSSLTNGKVGIWSPAREERWQGSDLTKLPVADVARMKICIQGKMTKTTIF